MKQLWATVKRWLQSLSFKTGVAVLAMCIPFYLASGVAVAVAGDWRRAGLWFVVLFGLAKTCQYGGLTILGVEGFKRLKEKLRKGKRGTKKS